MFVFCKILHKNPELAYQKAQEFHQKNNHRPIVHCIAHGALCAVFLRQREILSASKHVYLAVCAPFVTAFQRNTRA